MGKTKIVYEESIISKEDVEKINFDEQLVDFEGRKINLDQPQMSLIATATVLAIIIDISKGVIEDLLADKIEKLWNARNKNVILKKVDASGKIQNLKPIFKLIDNQQGTEITVIVNGDLSHTQIINIHKVLSHLKKDRYIFILSEDGTMKIYTQLAYAQSKHDLQNS
ncbi:hypothetical protein [Lactobacillus apis]|uniref:hypothetical protein n=1 Tax=Lactobacillus apis TaxID=303541 RepID=UPI00242FDFF8|nr:hypothetical protein [Lactobacillus apis]